MGKERPTSSWTPGAPQREHLWARQQGSALPKTCWSAEESKTIAQHSGMMTGTASHTISAAALRTNLPCYLIYYRKTRGCVDIIHIFHGAREQRDAFQTAGKRG